MFESSKLERHREVNPLTENSFDWISTNDAGRYEYQYVVSSNF